MPRSEIFREKITLNPKTTLNRSIGAHYRFSKNNLNSIHMPHIFSANDFNDVTLTPAKNTHLFWCPNILNISLYECQL